MNDPETVKAPRKSRVVFLSHHVYESPRRAGFHALARAFSGLGWETDFVTTGLSLLSVLRRDRRMGALRLRHLSTGIKNDDGVLSHAHFTALHPVSLPGKAGQKLEPVLAALYARGPWFRLRKILARGDMIIFESNASLLLAPRVKKIAPQAKLVYRVSDLLQVVGMCATIIAAEKRALPLMSLISSPSRYLCETHFAGAANVRHQPHGLPDAIYKADLQNPYPDQKNPVFVAVGSTLFDSDFVSRAARLRPEYMFHYVGDLPQLAGLNLPNVTLHGEVDFVKALAFSRFATVGLANYNLPERGEYLAETSNKMLQYAAFGRPIVAPRRIEPYISYRNVFFYSPGDDASIAKALDAAAACAPERPNIDSFPSWEQVAGSIVDEVAPDKSVNSQKQD